MDKFFNRHARVALLFSGGKDSMACLYKLKPYWDKLVVVWVNTGKNFPELEADVNKVRDIVPHFVEVSTCQDAFVKEHGYPTDVAWMDAEFHGRQFNASEPRQRVIGKYSCCGHNIWRAIEAVMGTLDCTGFAKGQRNNDHYKAAFVEHFVVNGRELEMCYPIRDMDESSVLAFLKEQGVSITPRFDLKHSSMDCWDCTAYWDAMGDRLEYMKTHHPHKREYVVKVLKDIKRDVEDRIAFLNLGEN